ncbi:MAG: EAL domain-containing protein [Amphritea sp.]
MKTIRFSIKWKAVTFLSAILLCICTFMVALYTYTLLQQANERAEGFNQQDNQVLEDLLSNTHLSLQQNAAIIPYLTNIKASVQQEDGVALVDALKEHWQSLSLNLDVHYLHLFTETGKDIGGYHTENQIDNKLMATLDAEARDIALRKQPGSILRCDAQCILFAIEPYILNDDTRGVIAIGQSIAPLVTRFKQLTGRDLAILKQSFSGSEARDLNNWGMSIWALSQFDTLSPLVTQAQNESVAPVNTLVDSSSGRHYRIHHIKYPPEQPLDNQPVFLSIADITQEEHGLKSSIINGIISGLSGLILSEILLLWVLWKPTHRLHQLAKALPLLAVHDYSQAKQIISKSNRSLLQDELDLLEQTALTVSCELEQMQAKVVTHAKQLELQMTEQVRARQFMAQLLDTAPLIIITQSVDAHIITMNHWGQTLTLWSSEPDCDKQMSSFIALHTDSSIPKDFVDQLLSLKNGDIQIFQHESQLYEANGKLRYITWMHSRVDDMAGTHSILSVGMDLTDRIEAENKLSWLASHDSLTGLMNRHSLQKRLNKALKKGHSGALLFIDVDRFKSVNDTAGHNVGDQLLKKIARILLNQMRDTDFVARLGGDEFSIMLPRANRQQAEQVMAKLSVQLNTQVSLSNGGSQHFSCSIGGALYPDHGSSDEELLASADMAMYNAKQNGQGRWHMYNASEAIIHRIKSDVSWQEKIRLAFNDNLFRLHFQPIYDFETCSVSHYEVLLRMQLATDQIILPGEFIPVAERTGMIWQIDEWVLTESLRFLSVRNQDHPDDLLHLAINVAAPTIQSPNFVSLFLRLSAIYQINPAQIIIEITETAFLEDFESAQKILKTLTEHGCTIALDDFGVGFSSFNYLKQMPLSYVKLDGSYIRDITANPQEQTFVRCLTEMVEGFHMKTIAEFVETPEVLQTVKALGVKCAQGYLIGRPSPYIEDPLTVAAELDVALEGID